MGTGYNPYRGADGRFCSREESLGIKVTEDYVDALESGNTSQAEFVERYATENVPDSALGKRLSHEKYGDNATVGIFNKNRLGEHLEPLDEVWGAMSEAELQTELQMRQGNLISLQAELDKLGALFRSGVNNSQALRSQISELAAEKAELTVELEKLKNFITDRKA